MNEETQGWCLEITEKSLCHHFHSHQKIWWEWKHKNDKLEELFKVVLVLLKVLTH